MSPWLTSAALNPQLAFMQFFQECGSEDSMVDMAAAGLLPSSSSSGELHTKFVAFNAQCEEAEGPAPGPKDLEDYVL